MTYLLTASILALCACLTGAFPQLINGLSAEHKRRMDRRKVGRIAFVGLMMPALILLVLYGCGVDHDLIPPVVCIPFALGTAVAIQLSIK